MHDALYAFDSVLILSLERSFTAGKGLVDKDVDSLGFETGCGVEVAGGVVWWAGSVLWGYHYEFRQQQKPSSKMSVPNQVHVLL